jgi:hypothetical protein
MVCVADWDGDGRLDLWLRNRTAPLIRFLHGRADPTGSWIAFDLVGSAGASHAVGSRVKVESEGTLFQRRLYAGEGYLGGSCHRLHIGLGERSGPADVRVEWTDGSAESFGELEPGRVWILEQGRGEAVARAPREQVELATLPGRPIPEAVGPLLKRVPLYDKLPFSAYPLETFGGDRKRVGDFAGRPLLVAIWATWNLDSQESLRALAAGRETLERARVSVWPVAFDTVRAEQLALDMVSAVKLGTTGGRLTPDGQIMMEAAFLDILGNFENPGLPLGLLFDSQGALSVMYFDALQPDLIAEDARLLEAQLPEPDSRWTTCLTGGHWARRAPRRDLHFLQRLYIRGGYAALARQMNEAIQLREVLESTRDASK